MAPKKETIQINSKINLLGFLYMRIVRGFLLSVGAWRGELFGEKVPLLVTIIRRGLPFQQTVLTFGSVYYLVKYYNTITFFDIGHIYISSFLAVVTIVRLSLSSFKTYCVIMKDFITKFHLVNFKDKGGYYNKMYTLLHKASHYFTLFQMGLMMFGLIVYNLSPIYNNYRLGAYSKDRNRQNLTLDFSIFFEYPGFIQNDHFISSTIINFYISYVASVCVCCLDLLLSLMVFQIIGHILILINEMETMPRPKKEVKHNGVVDSVRFDDEENLEIHKKIIGMVNHHRLIVGFADNMSNFFGPMIAVNYLFHLVGGCLLLLECNQSDPVALIRFGPLTVILFGQLIQQSVIFEVVGTTSEKLIDSVYFVPWECMNISNQKCIRFMLSRFQSPINVTAVGMFPVGVKTMQSILKSTLSYFAFLRTLNE